MQHRRYSEWTTHTAALLRSLALTFFLAASWQAGAQPSTDTHANPGSLARVSQVPLAGHTVQQVLDGTAVRVGHYNPEQKLRLVLAVQPPHMAEEEQFLEELHTKGSPNFHKYLSAEEWNERFGPSAEDEQKVVDWAESQGFTVTHRFANRLLVDVEAPVSAIEKALGVTINNYQVGDEVDFANDRDPLVPAGLEGILYAIQGLNSIQRMHGALASSSGVKGPDYVSGAPYVEGESSAGDGDPSRMPSSQFSPRPEVSNGTAEPSDIQSSQAYNYSALQALHHCCNPDHDASGSPPDSSIGVAAFASFDGNDLKAFFKEFGMAWNYTVYSIDGNIPSPGLECSPSTSGCPVAKIDGEVTIDTEFSTATSNSYGSAKDTAHVYVYEGVNELYGTSADLFNYMLSDGHARVLTTSWLSAESTSGSNYTYGEMPHHAIFNAMVGQGWTLIAAAGDNGATTGCGKEDAVGYPASDPNFVGAGGTELRLNSEGTYMSEVDWTGGTKAGSCKKNGGGGGGGVSALWSQPSWQKGLGGTMRLVPDISLNGGGIPQFFYYQGKWGGVLGTSIVAPELAGFFAQENAYLDAIGNRCGSAGTSRCGTIGNPDPYLYYEGMHPGYTEHFPFYDITKGCNSNDITAAEDLMAYCAGPGYDEATGWGSANMLQLAWALNYAVTTANGLPYVNYTGPATNKWYHSDQIVKWHVVDYTGPKGVPGTGIAGFTQGWDSIPADPAKEMTPGGGNSFYSGPQFPNETDGCLSFAGAGGCSSAARQGCHTVHVRGWNNQGWTTGDTTYGPICYDTVAPRIVVTDNPKSPRSTGWYTSPVTITLNASDPGGKDASGVSRIYFGVDSKSCETWNTGACGTYGSQLGLITQGVHTFIAFSSDKAGNFSPAYSQELKIDFTPPVTKADLSGAKSGGMWTGPVTVELKAKDNVSGVEATYYSIDGGTRTFYTGPFKISTVGKHTLDFWSVDIAGNVEEKNSDSFQIVSGATATLTRFH